MPRYSDKQIGEGLKKSRGMTYVAARQMGCSPNTIRDRLAKSEKLRDIKEAEEGLALDTGELKLMQAVNNDDLGAIKYLLSTKGKERGYSERTEHTGKDGASIVHRLVIEDSTSPGCA